MTDTADSQPYRVLARKYRPGTFASLIGQDAMVQTLSNAIRSNRLAHAFILTGVRGVGKTTTARIIACALNCVGPDGQGGPTVQPCGQCHHCVAIANDSDVDVLEMDAASHTSVDNIRELIENVVYRPVQARFRIYIIDEVHMLSRSAFNALLKTLEEPPEYAKFIFATTEIRKVPVTVLSRCQRFDLRRVETGTLSAHLARIAEQEQVRISREAIELITRAAGGSVRDGLSLLDQAIAHGGPDQELGEPMIRDMLGVAERVQVFDLFETLLKGEIADALGRFDNMYRAGADPLAILQDLAQLTHYLTRMKAAATAAPGSMDSDFDPDRSRTLSHGLAIPVLTRTWQMLLKGMAEVEAAYSPRQAAEMVLVRIAFASDLPTPAELVGRLSGRDASPAAAPSTPGASGTPKGSPAGAAANAAPVPAGPVTQTNVAQSSALPPDSRHGSKPDPDLSSFEQAVSLFAEKRESLLHTHLVDRVHLVSFEPGKIVLRRETSTPADLARSIAMKLSEWSGYPWQVEESSEQGEPTLGEKWESAEVEEKRAVMEHPAVRLALDTFPGAEITDVRRGNAGADGVNR